MTTLHPLDVSADLELQVDGETIHIRGDGPRFVVDLPSLRAGSAVMRGGPFRTHRRARLSRIDDLLRRAGLTADVRLSGVRLARLGAGARPGAFARLLRLGAVEVWPARSPGRSLGRSLRRRPGVAALAAGAAGLAAALWLRRRS